MKNNKKTRKDSFKLVRAIANGDNVDAYKLLEKAIRDRVSKKIDDAMKDA